MEIGVGSGTRARLWLDRFKVLDEQCGTAYYPRLKLLLGDYSPRTLDTALDGHGTARADGQRRGDGRRRIRSRRCRISGSRRSTSMSTNVYDNLPLDELVRRDGRLYIDRGASRTSAPPRRGSWRRSSASPRDELPGSCGGCSKSVPKRSTIRERGMAFWRCVWTGAPPRRAPSRARRRGRGPRAARADAPAPRRFAERARRMTSGFISRAERPRASRIPCRCCTRAGICRCRISSCPPWTSTGRASEGPGKLDGSIVAWVNGALLRAVGARAGYDVHFAPFRYRPGSKTTILFTTQRD